MQIHYGNNRPLIYLLIFSSFFVILLVSIHIDVCMCRTLLYSVFTYYVLLTSLSVSLASVHCTIIGIIARILHKRDRSILIGIL